MNSSGCKTLGRLIVFLLIAVVASGCERVRPIYQVENHPLPLLTPPLTLKQIETRIIKVGQLKNWRIRPIEPGRMAGMVSWRRHSAVVTIEYDQNYFNIRYKSSQNLLAGTAPEDQIYSGQFVIHRNYNKRVRALETAIDFELSAPNPQRDS